VTLAHNALTRAIRHAEANRHVMHNVGVLVDTPKGQPGRPSKALNAEQAAAVLKAAGELWTDHGLVFTTEVGTELDAASVRRSFRSVCRAADIGEGCACRRSNAPIRIICAQPSARATRLSAARNRQGELPSKQRGSRRQARSLRCPSNVPAIRPAVAAVGLLEAHRQPQDRMLRSRPQRRSP